MDFEFILTDSLEKVFPTQRPRPLSGGISALRGELPALQLAYYKNSDVVPALRNQPFTLRVEGAPVPARLRGVELLPSDFPAYERVDGNYLCTEPGLFPDLLRPLQNDTVRPLMGQWRAVWIDFPGLGAAAPGRYSVTVTAAAVAKYDTPNGTCAGDEKAAERVFSSTFDFEVLRAGLPAQALLHTEWFYADCLADYYNVPAFGEEHWRIVENFIAMAGEELGVNTLLTPVFTPPLDTAVGGERTTVQLVDIELENGAYRFGFEKLGRWCGICRAHGITHIEVAHFFTQWGAGATPKIMARVNGAEKMLFGWHVPATSADYRAFLKAFVPALRAALAGFGYGDANVLYHISDEPGLAQLEAYKAAKAQVEDLLDGCTIIDALSDYEFYKTGLVTRPVPANNHIGPFIENKVPNLWVYYCCGQSIDVPNRFFAMPSARNRIMGVLMYLYDIRGFLHWGYNFYNAQYSVAHINPYIVTHAGYAFPSGDAFLVYPGEDGRALSSLRGQVQRQALDDLGALRRMEELCGRPAVEALILGQANGPVTFGRYPTDAEYILRLRQAVNKAIDEAT